MARVAAELHWSAELSSQSDHHPVGSPEALTKLTHVCAGLQRAGIQIPPFSELAFELGAATKGSVASHNGLTGTLPPLNKVTLCLESQAPPASFTDKC